MVAPLVMRTAANQEWALDFSLQPPIPVARLLQRQLHQLRTQRFIAAGAAIAVRRHRQHHQPAGSPLAEGSLLLYLLNSPLRRYS
jgi:hypothetical protein